MINFKKVKWKNFLASGNTFNELEINNGLTLITSEKNGQGKSLILDAICFALFNKSFRGISKKNLFVNSINKKNCVVEIEFDSNADNYLVKRGLAPNIFEIYKNGTLINQMSRIVDYQRMLEENILKMNFKSFTQIVILGSSNYTPFLELSAANRREVVNSILDLDVISAMQNKLKDDYRELQNQNEKLNNLIDKYKNNFLSTKNLIDKLIKTKADANNKNKKEIDYINSEIDKLKSKQNLLYKERDKLSEEEIKSLVSKFEKTKTELNNKILLNKNEMKSIKKDLKFYNENSVCPSCDQSLEKNFVDTTVKDLMKKGKSLSFEVEEYNKSMNVILESLEDIKKQKSLYDELSYDINNIELNIKTQLKHIERLVAMQDTKNLDDDIIKEKNELNRIKKEALSIKNESNEIRKTIDVYEFGMILMKDTGFKTMVIKEYLPVINQLINMYLKKLDSYFYFEFDENFEDTVLARHTDELQYASLSGGERIRLTLAILFTWRYICIKKNTANCNLLILDEIFSESLDREGVDATISLLRELTDTHVFVLSPNSDVIRPKFNDIIEVSKPGDFSIYTRTNQ